VSLSALKRHPGWIRAKLPAGPEAERTVQIIKRNGLATVCREARCPNAGECWAHLTATFMILGDTCTGACRFCSVKKGRPLAPDPGEPERVAAAVAELGLKHVVITSVTRADLPDGGAGHFAAVARAIRARCPRTTIELLIPDFGGSPEALDTVLDSPVDILGHNLETVPRLYPAMRPRAEYTRSLGVLRHAAAAGRVSVKSALLLGLGEERAEVTAVLADLREAGCALLALGQYLKPTAESAPVARYLSPAEFDELGEEARRLGFAHVESAPLVRSSYHAWKYKEA